mmetsp:Transcript_29738/g.85145  ORF Transcript_29738/g.85145 Transcript_29738/m.85145 type:complete len:215 (+) Transcript_29738:123-767(+)
MISVLQMPRQARGARGMAAARAAPPASSRACRTSAPCLRSPCTREWWTLHLRRCRRPGPTTSRTRSSSASTGRGLASASGAAAHCRVPHGLQRSRAPGPTIPGMSSRRREGASATASAPRRREAARAPCGSMRPGRARTTPRRPRAALRGAGRRASRYRGALGRRSPGAGPCPAPAPTTRRRRPTSGTRARPSTPPPRWSASAPRGARTCMRST